MSDPSAAHRIGRDITTYLETHHPEAEPMEVTAAMAIALGAMVTSMNELGITKRGRASAILEHLFKIAEQTIVSGSSSTPSVSS